MRKSRVVYVVVAALAVCTQARAVEWDHADPVAGTLQSLRSAVKDMPTPAGQAAEPQAVPAGNGSIAGVAVADARISHPLDPKNLGFELVLNNTKDRVGANVSACWYTGMMSGGKNSAPVRNCQTIVYLFPSLRYDAATKEVLSGTEVVARKGGFWDGGALKLEKGFKPEFEIAANSVDRGFNRDTELSVKVALARASSR